MASAVAFPVGRHRRARCARPRLGRCHAAGAVAERTVQAGTRAIVVVRVSHLAWCPRFAPRFWALTWVPLYSEAARVNGWKLEPLKSSRNGRPAIGKQKPKADPREGSSTQVSVQRTGANLGHQAFNDLH